MDHLIDYLGNIVMVYKTVLCKVLARTGGHGKSTVKEVLARHLLFVCHPLALSYKQQAYLQVSSPLLFDFLYAVAETRFLSYLLIEMLFLLR